MKLAISGKMASGKDTAADYLVSQYKFIKTPFAKGLKMIAMNEFKCTYEEVYQTKPDHVRKALQLIGRAGTTYDSLVWVNRTLEDIRGLEIMYKKNDFVVSDLRFKVEAEKLKEEGFTLIRVERDVKLRSLFGISNTDDISETDLDDYKLFDYVIDNNGTLDELHDKLDNIITGLENEKSGKDSQTVTNKTDDTNDKRPPEHSNQVKTT